MTYTLAAMQTEVQARGFADMTSTADLTRITRWINDAMHDVDEQYDWAYLQATATGAAPLTITDLRKVEQVTDATNMQPLVRISRGEAADLDGNLAQAGGSPYAFYVTGGTQVAGYPASGVQLQVLYWKVAPDLVSGNDAPLMPDRFRTAIVDYAVAYGCDDRGDTAGAQEARGLGDMRVQRMADSFGMLEPSVTFVPAAGSDC